MAYASPFAAVAAFIADMKQAALPIFQPGYREHEGETLDKLAAVLRAMLGQNGQAPLPAAFSDIYQTGLKYRAPVVGLVALAGGGQAGATSITAEISRVATVATANDSAALPAASPGVQLTLQNAGANAMNLFPAVGEALNALAVNTAFSVPAGRTAIATCFATGMWSVGLLATA